MVDIGDLKSPDSNVVRVRVPLPVLKLPTPEHVSGVVLFLPGAGLEGKFGAPVEYDGSNFQARD